MIKKYAIKQGKTTHDEASIDYLIGGKGPHNQTKESQTAEEGVLLLLELQKGIKLKAQTCK